jgi:hypothetical protein
MQYLQHSALPNNVLILIIIVGCGGKIKLNEIKLGCVTMETKAYDLLCSKKNLKAFLA